MLYDLFLKPDRIKRLWKKCYGSKKDAESKAYKRQYSSRNLLQSTETLKINSKRKHSDIEIPLLGKKQQVRAANENQAPHMKDMKKTDGLAEDLDNLEDFFSDKPRDSEVSVFTEEVNYSHFPPQKTFEAQFNEFSDPLPQTEEKFEMVEVLILISNDGMNFEKENPEIPLEECLYDEETHLYKETPVFNEPKLKFFDLLNF